MFNLRECNYIYQRQIKGNHEDYQDRECGGILGKRVADAEKSLAEKTFS
jgi:hypothetical protein